MNASWFNDCTIYHFFPLGLCDCPHQNSWDWSNLWNAATRPVRRIDRILQWVEHIKKLNINAVYFDAVMQSDTHGYNTRDFYTLDSRLGSNEDFASVCRVFHENKIRIVLNANFYYVGRGFWAFRDVRKNLQKSHFINWFKQIDFSRNTPCADGFYYKSFCDNWDFPELNLKNEDVIEHIFDAIRKWVDLFSIDGLKVSVADRLDDFFLKRLREFCSNISAGLGGTLALLGGIDECENYNEFVNEKKVHSATNYELNSALCESFNSKTLFQLAYTLKRQFGPDGICKHTTMLNFLDNQLVSRFATNVTDPELLPLGWGMLFAFPGFPHIYYGSEWSAQGRVDFENLWIVRPAFEKPLWNELTDFIQKLCKIRKNSPALKYGDYRAIYIEKEQLMFERTSCGQTIIVALNLSEKPCTIFPKPGFGRGAFSPICGFFYEMFSEKKIMLEKNVFLPPKSIQYFCRIQENS